MWRRKGHSWARVPAQLNSVTQSCLTLWSPWTIPHQAFLSITNSQSLLKLMYIFSDAIQRSHPLFLSSPPTFNLSQYQGLFKWVCSSHQVAKVLEFQLQHMNTQDWSPLGWTGWSPCSPRDSQESSPTPQFKSINSLALSFQTHIHTQLLEKP